MISNLTILGPLTQQTSFIICKYNPTTFSLYVLGKDTERAYKWITDPITIRNQVSGIDIGVFTISPQQGSAPPYYTRGTDGITTSGSLHDSAANLPVSAMNYDLRKYLVSGSPPSSRYTNPETTLFLTQNTANQWNNPIDIMLLSGIFYKMTASNNTPIYAYSFESPSSFFDFANLVIIPVNLSVRNSSNTQCIPANLTPSSLAVVSMCAVSPQNNNCSGIITSSYIPGWSSNDECLDGVYQYCPYPLGQCGDENCKGPCPNSGDSVSNTCEVNSNNIFSCSLANKPSEQQQPWNTVAIIGIIIGIGVLIGIIMIIIGALIFIHRRRDNNKN